MISNITDNRRLLLLKDFREEQWVSMDFCAEMLELHLKSEHGDEILTESWCPPFHRYMQRLPFAGRKRAAFNADRLLNRFWAYPRALGKYSEGYDLFHICDHTYAQLALVLPANRTGVFCHDLDAFRSVIDPAADRRPKWFRAMASRQLRGMQRAAVVFYTTDDVRRQIDRHQLIDPSRLVKAPLGIAVEYTPQPNSGTILTKQLQIEGPYILHVGSCISRKRIDVLLDVFAELRKRHDDLRLVKVGGEFTEAHNAQIQRLGIGSAIVHLRDLSRMDVAHLYRKAGMVLLTSDNEGFGIPVIEALACGAIVVVSDIPVLREVAGDAACYCSVNDLNAWVETTDRILDNPAVAPDSTLRLARAALYSWQNHAQSIINAYQSLVRFGAIQQRSPETL